MKKIDLGQTITILANLGVIAGIVFLAVQVRQVGDQLTQDREIAAVDRMADIESNFYYWAELVNSDDDLWARGLSGESLTPNDQIRFDALAGARQFALYSRWFTAEREVSSADVTRDSFLEETAYEISSNPGFLAWWRDFYPYLVEIGRADDYDEALNEAVEQRLRNSGAD